MKRNSGRWMEILLRLLWGLGGGMLAAYCVFWCGPYVEIILLFLAGIYVMPELHHALFSVGRLICGRLTGYRLTELQLGPVLWQRTGTGELQRIRAPFRMGDSICLMAPPELKDGKMPYKLYLLGGVFANLLASALAAIAAWRVWHPLAASMLAMFALDGLFVALGIVLPIKKNGDCSAGYNARSIRRNPESLRALWSSLKAHEQMLAGRALIDMPEEWFFAPSGESVLRCGMCAVAGMNTALRRIYERRFEEALDLLEPLEEAGMNRYQEAVVRANAAFSELMLGRGRESAQAHLDKAPKKGMKKIEKQGVGYRLAYAMALLGEGDEGKAEEIRAQFEAYAARVSAISGAETRRLMDFVREKYDETRIGREAE